MQNSKSSPAQGPAQNYRIQAGRRALKLAKARKYRELGWGEGLVGIDNYAKAIKICLSLLEKMGKPQNEEEIVLVGETLRTLINSFQSQATHVARKAKEKESLLEKSKRYLKKLDSLRADLTLINKGLEGEFVAWEPEIERLWARCYYKQPRNLSQNFSQAQDYYQRAVDETDKMLKLAKNKQEKLILLGLEGVAVGEVARVMDERLSQFNEDFDEKEIFRLYAKSCDLVWEIRKLPEPEFDRIDAVLMRMLKYLMEHKISMENKEFKKLISRYKILVKRSELVRERMKILSEKEVLPEWLVKIWNK